MERVQSFQNIYGSIDSAQYAAFLLTLRETISLKKPVRQPLFIHDNARHHIGKLCKELFEEFPHVKLPPYSPWKNLIEYVFGFFESLYRNLNVSHHSGLSQESQVLESFSSITDDKLKVARLQMFDYLLKRLSFIKAI